MSSPVLALTYSATVLKSEPCASINIQIAPPPIPTRNRVLMAPLRTSLIILTKTGPATLPFSLEPFTPLRNNILALIVPRRAANTVTGQLFPPKAP